MAIPFVRRIESFPSAPRSLRDLERDPDARQRLDALIAAAYARAEIIGVGTQARVVSEPLSRAGAWWCAKEATQQPMERFNRTPREEAHLQRLAFDAVEQARAADPSRPMARIPEPIAYVELDPPEGTRDPIVLIIMERIMGTTAFRALLDHIVRTDDRFLDLRNDLNHCADAVLENALLTRLQINGRATREQVAALATLGTRLGFTVSRDAMIGVHRAVAAIHDARIFHRDAHPRNIMLTHGAGTPYIIDFGKSLHMPAYIPGSSDPYEEHYGEERIAYPNDGDFRAFLQQFAAPQSET